MDSMRIKAQKMMPSIMALNKNPTMGMKNNRQPKPGVSNLTAYAQGGSVKKNPSKDFGDFGRLPSDKMDFVKGRTPSKIFDTDAYMSGKTAGMNRQSKAKEDSALNAYANRGRDYIKDKLDDADVAISKRIGLTERAKNKESFRMGLKEEGYAKGGKVMAKGGAADKKQDKSMLSRHNKLMHPGQKSKLMSGGMVKGYKEGGGLLSRLYSKDLGKAYSKKEPEAKKKDDNDKPGLIGRLYSKDLGKAYSGKTGAATAEKPESLKNYKGPSTDIKINMPKLPSINMAKKSRNKDEDKPRSDDYFVKRAQQRNKETAPSDDYKPSGYKKGGKVKGDKKKVMGTVGEAKALMNAMKKVRRPATPMPGARMAGLGMAPPMAPQMMAPPMKRGGKVMKRAAGRSTKRHTNSKGV